MTRVREVDKSAPLVSVIIPAYNASKYIGRTLASAAAQTYSNLEIIVVDDGSIDGTSQIVAKAISSDSRIRNIATSNRGVAAARNTGVEVASGSYLAFLDADDLWHPTKVEKQVLALEALPDTWGGVYTLYYYINDVDEIMNSGGSRSARGYIYAQHISTKFVGNESALLVRREVIKGIGGFDTSYAAAGIGGCEDFDFELRLFARYKIEVIPERLVGYRIHSGNMSSDANRMAFSLLRTIERSLEKTPWLRSPCSRQRARQSKQLRDFAICEVPQHAHGRKNNSNSCVSGSSIARKWLCPLRLTRCEKKIESSFCRAQRKPAAIPRIAT